eukprot:m51a1_g14839 hypothetical protein (403) ;mRNA; f:731720-732928
MTATQHIHSALAVALGVLVMQAAANIKCSDAFKTCYTTNLGHSPATCAELKSTTDCMHKVDGCLVDETAYTTCKTAGQGLKCDPSWLITMCNVLNASVWSECNAVAVKNTSVTCDQLAFTWKCINDNGRQSAALSETCSESYMAQGCMNPPKGCEYDCQHALSKCTEVNSFDVQTSSCAVADSTWKCMAQLGCPSYTYGPAEVKCEDHIWVKHCALNNCGPPCAKVWAQCFKGFPDSFTNFDTKLKYQSVSSAWSCVAKEQFSGWCKDALHSNCTAMAAALNVSDSACTTGGHASSSHAQPSSSSHASASVPVVPTHSSSSSSKTAPPKSSSSSHEPAHHSSSKASASVKASSSRKESSKKESSAVTPVPHSSSKKKESNAAGSYGPQALVAAAALLVAAMH